MQTQHRHKKETYYRNRAGGAPLRLHTHFSKLNAQVLTFIVRITKVTYFSNGIYSTTYYLNYVRGVKDRVKDVRNGFRLFLLVFHELLKVKGRRPLPFFVHVASVVIGNDCYNFETYHLRLYRKVKFFQSRILKPTYIIMYRYFII